MISAAEFFSEYDALQKTASDAEREAWLISQCEMANPEGPQEQRVLSTMYNELGSFYKHRDMLEKGWQETTHPGMRDKSNSRDFFDPSTGITIRFDKGKPEAPGFRGKNHYHIENPNRTGKQDFYLDKDGNPVPKGSNASHIIP